MIGFAYDGSLNGDWVAHYAARFAANDPDRRLSLIHVGRETAELSGRIERIERECSALDVGFERRIVAPDGGSVARQILDLVPATGESVLVCGTRARPRNLTFLAGTVSAELLALRKSPVLALRVVHPGTLGQPGRVLLPLAGHPRGAKFALPLLRWLGADLHRVHVLHVREVSRLRFRVLGASAAERMMRSGRGFVREVEREIRNALPGVDFELDGSVVVSDDVPKEIAVQAGKLQSRLIALGASERGVAERLVYGSPIEQILRDAPCDVAVYRSVD